MPTIVLHVDGMTCDGCAASVARVARTVAGVRAVAVTLATRRAEVVADDAGAAPRIAAALTTAGFPARPA